MNASRFFRIFTLLTAFLLVCAVGVPARGAADPLSAMVTMMTREQLVGQLFMIRCPASNVTQELARWQPGGVVLFGRDISGHTPQTLGRTLSDYQEAVTVPLFIAVDEEGGTVCRVSSEPAFRESRFPSPRAGFRQGGLETVLAMEEEKAILLTGLGINVNLGPVCDIATDPSAFMYQRSLGQSPEITARFIGETVQLMSRYQLGSVLKHFPGYGANADTHTGIARDSRPLETLQEADLIPFQAGIDSGCGAIMVSHNIVEAFDGDFPATLSPEVHRYIRQEMGFDGVILTDDLAMGAITQRYGTGEAAVLAVLAGNDMLCCTEYATQYTAVLEAVESGRIPREMLEGAVCRILRWKQQLGLLPEFPI